MQLVASNRTPAITAEVDARRVISVSRLISYANAVTGPKIQGSAVYSPVNILRCNAVKRRRTVPS
jgi:hypothetical protein